MIICPGCGADMHFSPSTQMLVCDYCEATLSPDDYAKSEGLLTQDSNYYETTIFSCPQCGGEIMNTEETAATFCSYCGASVQLMSRIGKEKRPKKIIPFTVDTKECQEKFNKKIKRAIFAPSFLRKGTEINKFRGIYMPYWSFGFTVDQTIKGEGETEKRKGDYIITDYFQLEATAQGTYDGISFDSASNFDDDISERISPFETKNAKDFNPAYMSGFYADRGDVESNIYVDDAKTYLKQDISSAFETLPEFKDLTMKSDEITKQIEPGDEKASFVLYPVWFLTNKFGKDRLTYAVANGQTGKIAADIPIDPRKYILISLLVALPIFLILNRFPAIEPKWMLIITMILHVICTLISVYQGISIEERENRDNDKGYKSIQAEGDESKKITSFYFRDYIYHAVILLAGILLFIIAPASDYVYYACSAVAMIAVSFSYIRIIKQYNLLSTHKLPQFEKRGGDENE